MREGNDGVGWNGELPHCVRSPSHQSTGRSSSLHKTSNLIQNWIVVLLYNE